MKIADVSIKKKILYFSFGVPAFVMLISFLVLRFFPFGDKTILTIDSYFQYTPFMSELRHKILNFESLSFSWHAGLGVNFRSLMSYYLGSPFNLLLPLFPQKSITDFMLVATWLKISFSGLTFSYLLYEGWIREKREKVVQLYNKMLTVGDEARTKQVQDYVASKKLTLMDLFIIIISCFYAVSGYVVTYSWNIMWLDIVMVFPLLVLGVIKLVKRNQIVLYTLSLAFILISNYYIAYFACVFTFFYFFAYTGSHICSLDRTTSEKFKLFIKKFLQIGLSTITALALAAFSLLPTIESLMRTSASKDKLPATFEITFKIIEFLTRHLIGVPSSIRSGLPNVYCGVLVFIIVPMYILSKKIKLQEKIFFLLLLVFLYVSMASNVLSFAWHGFHYPNQLPYRFSFVYIALILIMGFRSLQYWKSYSWQQVRIAFISTAFFMVLVEFINKDALTSSTIYINLIVLILYASIFGLRFKKKINTDVFVICLTACVVMELMVNTFFLMIGIDSKEHYSSRAAYIENMSYMKTAQEYIKDKHSGLARLEVRNNKTINDGMLYNFNALSVFSSSIPDTHPKTMKKIGFDGNNINSYIYRTSSVVMDMLLDIKYSVQTGNLSDTSPYFKEIVLHEEDNKTGLKLYENEMAIDFGFWIPNKLDDANDLSHTNGIENQKIILESISNNSAQVYKDTLYQIVKYSGYTTENIPNEKTLPQIVLKAEKDTPNKEADLIVHPEQDGQVYAFLDTHRAVTVKIQNNNEQWDSTSNSSIMVSTERSANQPQVVDLGYAKAGDEISISLKSDNMESQDIKMEFYTIDDENFRTLHSQIKEGQFMVEEAKSNKIEGFINAKEDGWIFMPTAYDPNWIVEVDGQTVRPTSVIGSFLGIPITKGIHQVKMRYQIHNQGFYATISIIALGALFVQKKVYAEHDNKKNKEKARKSEK